MISDVEHIHEMLVGIVVMLVLRLHLSIIGRLLYGKFVRMTLWLVEKSYDRSWQLRQTVGLVRTVAYYV